MMNKVLAISLFLFTFTVTIGFASKDSPGKKDIGIAEASRLVQDTVKKYFIQDQNTNITAKASEESGLYKVDVSVGNINQAFYLTKDGLQIIFPDGIVSIAKLKESARKEAVKQNIPKNTKPLVELYVMSLCPYGIQAEKKILPLMDHFCDSVDFKIRYIVDVKGETIKDVRSLHGIDEVKENMREAAVLRFQADKFPVYLEKIDKGACLISCGAAKLDDYWKEAAKESGIDIKQVESFVNSPLAMELLKQDADSAKKYNVSSSPTLIINGVKSEAIYANSVVLKQAICSAFAESPAACKEYSDITKKP